jgi:predicted DsbA family dithiol-disulfide isomerase
MHAYFAEGVDVSDPGELVRLAGEVGLDATGVLDGDAYGDVVRAGEAEAAELDIYAVPTFVIGRALVVPGAQDPETFVSLLARARERLTPG